MLHKIMLSIKGRKKKNETHVKSASKQSEKSAIRMKKKLRLIRETRDLHVGLHGSQRLPAQHLLPPARWTVEITLAHCQSSISRYHPLRLLTTVRDTSLSQVIFP